jgi:putative tryptophan/tyrosine transport system substrate-binding protein
MMFNRLPRCALLAALILMFAEQTNQALAQQASEIARVGILGFGPQPPPSRRGTVNDFRRTLADLGYVEGKSLIIEERWQPPGKKDWLPEAIAELESTKVQAFFAFGAVPVRALRAAGTTIPIVFTVVVSTREFVSNPEKPEGNMTGFTIFNPKLPHEQLELVRQVAPNARRIAFVGDGSLPDIVFKPYEDTAGAKGLGFLTLKLQPPQPDLEGAFTTIQSEQADAVVVLPHPLTSMHRVKIAEYVTKLRLPSLWGAPGFADAGGLLIHGTDFGETAKPAAEYVSRILRGAKPSELPVQTIIRNKLIVNLKTAESLSITVPPTVLNAATDTIR